METDQTALAKLTYSEIRERLVAEQSTALVVLLSSKSRKIGDVAAELLAARPEGPELVIRAILADGFSHRDDKVRAMYVLDRRGRSCPASISAYLHLVSDRNEGVVSSALFGLVFFRYSACLPNLRARMASLPEGHGVRALLKKAIEALEKQDPSIYSPFFWDRNGVWAEPDRPNGDS